MKIFFSLFVAGLSLTLFCASAFAEDKGDRACQIFVIEAGNVITGGAGNYIDAKVAVSKNLIKYKFPNYLIKISGYEEVKPTKVTDAGDFLVFSFEKYRQGINYRRNSATIVVYITDTDGTTDNDGVNRLYDNNDNVWLVREHNWQYTNQRCKL